MHHTILHQMNKIYKQKSQMSKKYLHSCSSCTNTNNCSVKHMIEHCIHQTDRTYQLTYLCIYSTLQKCNLRKIFTIAQFNKILAECK